MLLVDAAHQSRCWGQDLVDKDENGLLGRQLNALANDVNKLSDSKIRGYKILFLVDGGNVALLYLFADDLRETSR